MVGTLSYGVVLSSHSIHWSTLWVCHPSSSGFIQASSQSHSKLITAILAFITMSDNNSSTGTPTAVTTATDLSGSQDPQMLPVILWFVGPHVKFNDGRFTNKIGFSASKLSFVNGANVWWYISLIASYGCADKNIYVDAFFTSFSLHNSVALVYSYSIPHYNIIIAGRCHITNWYCNNSACHMCTTCVTLASYWNIFQFPTIW